MEIINIVLTELAKSFFGEIGKAGARVVLSQREQKQPEALAASPRRLPEPAYDPLQPAEEAVDEFLNCLAAGDHDAAWTWCDPRWPNDRERSQSYSTTFSAAPPISWCFVQNHIPNTWRIGEKLPWAMVETVVTFDAGDGTYTALPAMVVAISGTNGWRIADVVWDPHARQEQEPEVVEDLSSLNFTEIFGFELQPMKQVIQCERCPQKLSIPVGVGRIRLKCPACWTPQEIDT